MMQCHDFRSWLVGRGIQKESLEPKARDHVEECEPCRLLANADSLIEDRIRAGLRPVDPPRDLFARLEMDIRSAESETGGAPLSWKRLVPALAIAVLLVAIVLNPFSGRIESLDQISSLALANHMDPNLTMVFHAREITDVSGWFSDKLGFPVSLPKRELQGSTLLGGRECLLGKEKVAYLFYEKRGQRISLFIIDSGDLSIPVEEERVYGVSDKGHNVKVWREGDLVYALVK